MTQGHFTFLGTGGSMGVPFIGCNCAVCRSSSSKNKRLRPSGLLTFKDKSILIDAGPDLREQALRQHLERIDGLLLTHTHYDHMGGIDDLRAFYFIHKNKVPCLVSKETMEDIRARLPHLLAPIDNGKSLAAQIEFQVLEDDFGAVNFQGIQIKYLSYMQKEMKVTGFRFNDFAYVSDIREFTDEVFVSLKGVEILVLSALRHNLSAGHFTLEEAIAFSSKVEAKMTWLTHIGHELDHEETNRQLPSNVQLAYDGQEITFNL